MKSNSATAKIYPILCVLLMCAILYGMFQLEKYDTMRRAQAAIPSDAPSRDRLALDSTLPTLIMFAHPLCPCTRASIGELAVLMAKCPSKARAYVVFVQLKDVPDAGYYGSLREAASEIPGVRTVLDPDGRIARSFGAITSGQVVLYSPSRKLLFEGGITSERGHSGDSIGEDTLVSLLNGANPACKNTPVFGCSLFDASGAPSKEGNKA